MRPLNEFATAELAILARSLPQLSYRTYDHASSLKRKKKKISGKFHVLAYDHCPEQRTILIPNGEGKENERNAANLKTTLPSTVHLYVFYAESPVHSVVKTLVSAFEPRSLKLGRFNFRRRKKNLSGSWIGRDFPPPSPLSIYKSFRITSTLYTPEKEVSLIVKGRGKKDLEWEDSREYVLEKRRRYARSFLSEWSRKPCNPTDCNAANRYSQH